MKRTVAFQGVLVVLLLLVLATPAATQTKRRQKQIKGLIKKSDLVALAVAQAYYPVIDLKKYRREQEKSGGFDPRRRSKYTFGTVYRLRLKEVLFQKPQKDSHHPRRMFFAEDIIMIYVKGPPAHPLALGQAAFFPGTEYLVFLKRTKLDPGDFRRGVRQDVNAPVSRWERFPSPVETYFKVVEDPLAARPMDDVWRTFADHTRRVAHEMAASRSQ